MPARFSPTPRIVAVCVAVVLAGCAFNTDGVPLVTQDVRDASVDDDEPGDGTVDNPDAPLDMPAEVDSETGPETSSDTVPDVDVVSCSNGKKDGSETDIDCGGSCSPCAVARSCAVSADCAPNICPASKTCALPTSCAQIHNTHATAATGVYALRVGSTNVTTRCEMDIDGGGWTLVQRTTWAWTNNTAQLQTDFLTFFNQSAGSVANAWRVPGSIWSNLLSAGDVLAVVRARKSDGTSCPSLYYKNSGATLSANTGTKTMTFSGLTGTPKLFVANDLSTLDSGPASSCVVTREAVPGFYGNCCEICPSFGSGYWSDSPHPMAQEFSLQSTDLFSNTLGSSCGSGLARTSTYVGLNSLEFYFR